MKTIYQSGRVLKLYSANFLGQKVLKRMKLQLLDVNVDVVKRGGGAPLISEKKFVSEAQEDQEAEVNVRGEVGVEVVLVVIVGFDSEERLPVHDVLRLHGDVVLQVHDQGVHMLGGKVAGCMQLQEGVVE